MADILVVDDDPTIILLLADILTEAGHTVRSAGSGAGGLIAVGTQRPALVLLDLQMPIGGGEVVARELRAFDTTLPIVLISADLERANALIEARHADALLVKPFDPDTVRTCVEQFVS
jgi:CheY-like chemotaxis protein